MMVYTTCCTRGYGRMLCSQAQHRRMQESLRCAEAAAEAAAGECAGLVAAVQALVNQEARSRSCQAHKVHQLKESLLQTSAALRQAADTDRKSQNEVSAGEH